MMIEKSGVKLLQEYGRIEIVQEITRYHVRVRTSCDGQSIIPISGNDRQHLVYGRMTLQLNVSASYIDHGGC